MKRKHNKTSAKEQETPAVPRIYRHDPTTDLEAIRSQRINWSLRWVALAPSVSVTHNFS